jgi:hypothetical protein
MVATPEPSFIVPSCLQDLERSPYNLLPYPEGFDESNEATRSTSFELLLDIVREGNGRLNSRGISLFFDDEEVWLDDNRMQSLYTLVR